MICVSIFCQSLGTLRALQYCQIVKRKFICIDRAVNSISWSNSINFTYKIELKMEDFKVAGELHILEVPHDPV